MPLLQNDGEYYRPPEEFPLPAAQSAPLPPEFGSGGEGAPSAKKKKKYHWLAAALAAGLLSTVAMFGNTEKVILEPFVSPTPASATSVAAAPSSTPDHTPSPSPVPPGDGTPSSVPTDTPKPTPGQSPAVRLTFYRTSQVYHVVVALEAREKMESVSVRLYDPILEETVWEYSLTDEDLAKGIFVLEDFDLSQTEYAHRHFDRLMAGYEPDPILEVVYTARTDDGEQTFTEQAEAADELQVSARYDLKDPEEDFLYTFLERTTYPDCFVVRIDPSPYGELNIRYGESGELQPGDVSVTLSVNGETLSGDGWHLEKTETVYDEGMLYAYALVIPRPASCPEHGTVHVWIVQRLLHFESIVTRIMTVEY